MSPVAIAALWPSDPLAGLVVSGSAAFVAWALFSALIGILLFGIRAVANGSERSLSPQAGGATAGPRGVVLDLPVRRTAAAPMRRAAKASADYGVCRARNSSRRTA